jgi:peptide/nickel transport system permease protein
MTYMTLQDIMQHDFIRVARSRSGVITGHALKNAAIPIMTTMGASLRYSLASLPIVESFFL